MGDAVSPSVQPSVDILGVSVHELTREEAVDQFIKFLDDGKPHQIATVNPEFLVLAQDNPVFRHVLLGTDLRLADGIGIILASWVLGRPLPGRLPGVDMILTLSAIAEHRRDSVYLLGAGPGVAEQAAAALRERFPALRVAGAEMGPAPGAKLSREEDQALAGRIRAANPSVLFVAFGAPLQELWLAQHKDSLGVPVTVGVGGSFDVLSGRIPRAPRMMRRLGLEWLFRLIRMPWRWRRQLSRLPRFVGLVARQWWRESHDYTGTTPILPP